MILVIDIDGVICEEGEDWQHPPYSCRLSVEGSSVTINKLWAEGHTIILHTARPWTDFKETAIWLQERKVRYDTLVMGKPYGDVYIDDKALRFSSWKEVKETIDAT